MFSKQKMTSLSPTGSSSYAGSIYSSEPHQSGTPIPPPENFFLIDMAGDQLIDMAGNDFITPQGT